MAEAANRYDADDEEYRPLVPPELDDWADMQPRPSITRLREV